MSKVSVQNVSLQNDVLCFTIQGTFEQGLDKSLINGIRRTLLNDIPTVAFNINEASKQKDIIIETNTSSIHNEMIQERIGLIPLYINPDIFHKSYLFYLNVIHNKDTPFQFVTANDIQIYPLNDDLKKRVEDMMDESIETSDLEKEKLNEILSTNDLKNYNLEKELSQKQKETIFRPFVYKQKKNYCLLLELKNTNTEDVYQQLKFYGSPSVNTTKTHARYQSVSCATYNFTLNNDLIQSTLDEQISLKNIPAEEIEDFKNKFLINESERYYHRDKDNEPYSFDFKIKSTHYLSSEKLFLKAIQILNENLNSIKDGLILLLQEKDTNIELSMKNDYTYLFELFNMDHTIGSMIQSHISRFSINDKSLLQMCGYKKTHPLEECIHLICSINPNHKSFKEEEKIRTQKVIQFLIDEIIAIQSIYQTILKSAEKAFQ